MRFITRKKLSRRKLLRGLGTSVALPLLDAMVPAMAQEAQTRSPARMACLEMVHGSAGATDFGAANNMWSPAAAGSDFDLSPTSMRSLEPYREYLSIISNTDCHLADAFSPNEVGGDHNRCSAVYLTQSKPKQTLGSDIYAGISIDQLYAQRFGQDTPLPSLQLAIESDDTGGCQYGYSCVYMGPISWSSATQALPAIRDPRMVFDQLFGGGGTPQQRASRQALDRSILDWISEEVGRLKQELGPSDQYRLDQYLTEIREVERRIQRIEEFNSNGMLADLPTAPIGIPDSFDEHMQIMFDLQTIAFASEITRVSSFKLSRDATGRTFPNAGYDGSFHLTSHHGESEEMITNFAKINQYHVSMIPYFLEKLKNTPDGDGNLLDNTVVMYGSPMGNSNVHNHKRCPLFLAGLGGGQLQGNNHLIMPDGTPMANVFLSLLNKMGFDELESFGDSNGVVNL